MRAAFTIVLNGIKHLENWGAQNASMFDLWVIVEGAVDPVECTSWCKPIPEQYVCDGGSVDGTREYLDDLPESYPNVVIVQKDSGFWKGKKEMVQAAIDAIKARGLNPDYLWQVDADEYWLEEELEAAEAELSEKNATSMTFLTDCLIDAKPDYIIQVFGQWGEGKDMNFRRLWEWHDDLTLFSHEPPRFSYDDQPIISQKIRTFAFELLLR